MRAEVGARAIPAAARGSCLPASRLESEEPWARRGLASEWESEESQSWGGGGVAVVPLREDAGLRGAGPKLGS